MMIEEEGARKGSKGRLAPKPRGQMRNSPRVYFPFRRPPSKKRTGARRAKEEETTRVGKEVGRRAPGIEPTGKIEVTNVSSNCQRRHRVTCTNHGATGNVGGVVHRDTAARGPRGRGVGNCARALRFNACRTELPNAAALGAAGATYAVSAIR